MKIRIQLSLAAGLLAIVLMGCEPEPDHFLVRHFTVAKGEHYSTPRLVENLQSNRLIFTAQFDESAKYDLGDAAMQSNKNKLLGFADSNSMHHKNSARFAWQWYNNQLEIYAYCYVNSERVESYVGIVQMNELNHFEIALTDDAYLFYLNGAEPVRVLRKNSDPFGIYYMLWPYFGGTLPAPQQIRIAIAIQPQL